MKKIDKQELKNLLTIMLRTVKERNDNASSIYDAIPDGDEDVISNILADVDDHRYEGHNPDELVTDILDALEYGEYPFSYDSDLFRQSAESMMANSEKIHKLGDKIIALLNGDVYCDEIGDFLSDVEDSMYGENEVEDALKDILDIMERLAKEDA